MGRPREGVSDVAEVRHGRSAGPVSTAARLRCGFGRRGVGGAIGFVELLCAALADSGFGNQRIKLILALSHPLVPLSLGVPIETRLFYHNYADL